MLWLRLLIQGWASRRNLRAAFRSREEATEDVGGGSAKGQPLPHHLVALPLPTQSQSWSQADLAAISLVHRVHNDSLDAVEHL